MSMNASLQKLVRCAALLCLGGTAMAGTTIVVTEPTQAAIQAALNTIGGPGTVLLMPGRYPVDGTLIIRDSGVTLRGSGADQTVLFRTVDRNTAMLRSSGNANGRW